jgi:hypothetical protein
VGGETGTIDESGRRVDERPSVAEQVPLPLRKWNVLRAWTDSKPTETKTDLSGRSTWPRSRQAKDKETGQKKKHEGAGRSTSANVGRGRAQQTQPRPSEHDSLTGRCGQSRIRD